MTTPSAFFGDRADRGQLRPVVCGMCGNLCGMVCGFKSLISLSVR